MRTRCDFRLSMPYNLSQLEKDIFPYSARHVQNTLKTRGSQQLFFDENLQYFTTQRSEIVKVVLKVFFWRPPSVGGASIKSYTYGTQKSSPLRLGLTLVVQDVEAQSI